MSSTTRRERRNWRTSCWLRPAGYGSGAQALLLGVLAATDRSAPAELAAQARDAVRTCGISDALLRLSDPASAEGTGPLDSPPRVEVLHCFGGFVIRVDGREVDLRPLRPRAQALLRFLVLSQGHDVHRERLVDLLWPGADVPTGTRRLQVAVSSVRKLLEGAGLPGAEPPVRRSDAYRFQLPHESTHDVRDFECAVQRAAAARARQDSSSVVVALREALALYRGDLLPEEGAAS